MDPKVLLIAGEKGGTGKSTICTNLASLLATAGNDVLIIDTDKQASSSDWCYERNQTDLPKVEAIQLFGKQIQSETESKANRYDKVLIDAGGRDTESLRRSMLVADMLLTPVRASQYDISSLGALDSILDELKTIKDLPAYAVINSLKSNPNMPEFTDAVEAIQQYDNIEPLSFAIKDRISFARTGQTGQGVHEMDPPDQKATKEIQTLYSFIYG